MTKPVELGHYSSNVKTPHHLSLAFDQSVLPFLRFRNADRLLDIRFKTVFDMEACLELVQVYPPSIWHLIAPPPPPAATSVPGSLSYPPAMGSGGGAGFGQSSTPPPPPAYGGSGSASAYMLGMGVPVGGSSLSLSLSLGLVGGKSSIAEERSDEEEEDDAA
jgi:hypothetical protein